MQAILNGLEDLSVAGTDHKQYKKKKQKELDDFTLLYLWFIELKGFQSICDNMQFSIQGFCFPKTTSITKSNLTYII